MLRRLLAITLLIAFGLPLGAQLLNATPDPDSSLPACCRRHGKHHCAMLLGAAPHGQTFEAPPCQSYPNAATPSRSLAAFIRSPPRTAGETCPDSATTAARLRPPQVFPSFAHLTRGPPVRSV